MQEGPSGPGLPGTRGGRGAAVSGVMLCLGGRSGNPGATCSALATRLHGRVGISGTLCRQLVLVTQLPQPQLSPPLPPPRCLLPLGSLSCLGPRSFRSRRQNLARPSLPDLSLVLCVMGTVQHVTGSIRHGQRLWDEWLSCPRCHCPMKGPGKQNVLLVHIAAAQSW